MALHRPPPPRDLRTKGLVKPTWKFGLNIHPAPNCRDRFFNCNIPHNLVVPSIAISLNTPFLSCCAPMSNLSDNTLGAERVGIVGWGERSRRHAGAEISSANTHFRLAASHRLHGRSMHAQQLCTSFRVQQRFKFPGCCFMNLLFFAIESLLS